MKLKRVVVTGLGALTPIGNDLESYWDGLVNGISGAAPITYFDAAKFKTRFACDLKTLKSMISLTEKKLEKWIVLLSTLLCLLTKRLKDAGFDLDAMDMDRIGGYGYAGIGGIETFENEVINFANGDGTPKFNPFFIPKMIADIAPGMVSIRHGFQRAKLYNCFCMCFFCKCFNRCLELYPP